METFLGLHKDYNVIADTTAPFKVPCLFLSPNMILLFGWYTSVSFFCVFMDTYMYKNIQYYLWPIMGVSFFGHLPIDGTLGDPSSFRNKNLVSKEPALTSLPNLSSPFIFLRVPTSPWPGITYKFVYSITAYLLPLEGNPPTPAECWVVCMEKIKDDTAGGQTRIFLPGPWMMLSTAMPLERVKSALQLQEALEFLIILSDLSSCS